MSNESHDIHKEAVSRRYADLLDARADAEELQLIDDLETLYASATLPAQLNSEQSPGSSQAYFMEGLAGDLNTQQHIVPDLPSVTLSNYSFVSDSIGWAIGVSSTKTSVSIPSVLLKTTNGGKTWKQIRYVVS